MYWSAVQMFRKRPEKTVDMIMPTRRFMKRRKTAVRLSNMPLAVMAPPKHMAQIMSQMVSIMPDMPRVATRLFRASLPVSTLVPP